MDFSSQLNSLHSIYIAQCNDDCATTEVEVGGYSSIVITGFLSHVYASSIPAKIYNTSCIYEVPVPMVRIPVKPTMKIPVKLQNG